jgi:hypothetical protein
MQLCCIPFFMLLIPNVLLILARHTEALEEFAAVAEPDTLLAWYRKLIANKFDGSKFRQRVGRPRIDKETERLVLQMAKENPSWGYDRIVGALANLGFLLSDQTVGNILRRHGFSPAPKRKQAVFWKNPYPFTRGSSGWGGFFSLWKSLP